MGIVQQSGICDYTYRIVEWGNAMFVTPGVVVDGEASHYRSGKDQPRHSNPSGAVLTMDVGRRLWLKRCQ